MSNRRKREKKKKKNSDFRALYLQASTHLYNETSREHADCERRKP
jgi:hypothetical protein